MEPVFLVKLRFVNRVGPHGEAVRLSLALILRIHPKQKAVFIPASQLDPHVGRR
jgi:hypothetical protein